MNARCEAVLISNREDEEAQFALELQGLCKEFHVLPREGGLYDQSPHDIMLLKAALYGRQAKQKYDENRKKPAKRR